ncbi:MAG: Z1 domain-containing protein [Sulfurospirillum cavolei]|nr:Z1 domain-containing protein [Sulfurospirillum cavolei]
MNDYQRIKTYLFGKLQEIQSEKGLLDKDDLDDEFNNVKILISSPKVILNAIFNVDVIDLSDNDLSRMRNELETLFDVRMDQGILIQGDEQQKRDTSWWTGKKQQESENFYWNRYKQYFKKSLPEEVIKTIDIDSDIVMDNLENPENNTFNIYGMVVGHVQSGKTANYSSLICKAADAGYKFIVVIAGGINNLRNQTQERINEAFIGVDKGQQIGAGIGNAPLEKLPISLTTVENDFNINDARRNSQGTNFETNTTPILLVIKKNTTTLQNVISWLENQYKNKISNHAMLLIDDESDYASINTNDENDPTKINERLRKLLSLFHKSCYVAYTATPFANIFINHEVNHDKYGEDLFPRDFIYTLDAPTNYFGAKKIFIESEKRYLISIPENDYKKILPLGHKKDFVPQVLPESIFEAIRLFLLNIAIRWKRGQEQKHNSMLIHATRFTDVHRKLSLLVENYLSLLKSDISSYLLLKNAEEQSVNIQDLRITFEKYYMNIEFSWDEIKEQLHYSTKTVIVREVHQKRTIELEYRKDRPTNAIVIGGTSVARGFTLEGLSISCFLRNTVFYDTLMQMGRWFGYRDGYEDLCKIYMSEEMMDNFTQIIEAIDDLIQNLRLMATSKRTPLDFGLAVRQHPDSLLQITAKNKLKNTKKFLHSMNLNGHLKETVRFSKDIEVHQYNFDMIEQLIRKLPKIESGKYIWRDQDKSFVTDFLKNFKIYDARGIQGIMPILHIQKYAETIDTKWDIVLYTGESSECQIANLIIPTELRKKYQQSNDCYEIGQRKISSGSPEVILLGDSDIQEMKKKSFTEPKEQTKFIRKRLKNPILMLHILNTDFVKFLPAFGVCFPDNGLDSTQTVELTMNTVMIKINEFEEMDFDD